MVPRPVAALALALALLAAASSARAQEGLAPAPEAGAMRMYPRFSNVRGWAREREVVRHEAGVQLTRIQS